MATIFEGDNGGATNVGVTSMEIRVAIPGGAATFDKVVAPLFDYFNQHFELYGRRLVPVYVAGSTSDPVGNRALAADVAAQGVFASLASVSERNGNLQDSFLQELARRGVISIALGAGLMLTDRSTFDALHPYAWSVYPSAEHLWRNLGDFACTSLAGRPARLAPDAELRSSPRKFGIVAYGKVKVPWIRPLVDALTPCDQDVEVVQAVADSGGSAALTTGLSRLKAAGVSTVVCACEYGYWITVHSTSHGLGYHPEWLQASERNVGNDSEYFHQYYRNFGMQPFGVLEQPKLLPQQAQQWFQALVETSPKLLDDTTFGNDLTNVFAGSAIYDSLMVLASGIQSAGPQLTAVTFAQGLMATRFPNTGAGQAPYFQPSVGFGPGDHSFYDDYALGWWEPAAQTVGMTRVEGGSGSWCYLGAGTRYSVGAYPPDDSRFMSPTEVCR